jgi:hypothetical protein
MMDALSEINLSISETQWQGIERRLRHAIVQAEPEQMERTFASSILTFGNWGRRAAVSFLAAAALLLISITFFRFSEPVEPDTAVYVEHTVPLDPVTVDFLAESEKLLRNVMKMSPSDVEDLAGARQVASEQLAELGQRKEAVADVPPVVSVMRTYETILRDLRNVDESSADEDISDIQRRIEHNALIANMEAFQPRITEINFTLK